MTKDKSMICENYESVCHSSGEEAGLLTVLLGGRPAGKHEADLVDEVSNVVHHVQEDCTGDTGQEAKEVAQRVDGPAKADDDAHVAEGLAHCLRDLGVLGGGGGLAGKDLVEDEAPAAHAQDESRPLEARSGLANVAEREHHDGADEEAPETTAADSPC